VEYCEGSIEDFKTYIYDNLDIAARSASAKPLPSSVREIALIFERGDKTTVNEVRRFLIDIAEIEPILLSLSEHKFEDTPFFEKSLMRCAQCMIFWGAKDEDWLQRLLLHDGLAKRAGDKSLCVYILPPLSEDKSMYKTRKALVIDGTSGVNADKLQGFLDQTTVKG
jgi:hypothetical protein